MTPDEIEKIINETKELRDIRDEYIKTEQLLKEKNFNELKKHIDEVAIKHLFETMVYNAINNDIPQPIEQNAKNCMAFLDMLLREKLALKIKELLE